MQEEQTINSDFWKREIVDDFNRASDFDTWFMNFMDEE